MRYTRRIRIAIAGVLLSAPCSWPWAGAPTDHQATADPTEQSVTDDSAVERVIELNQLSAALVGKAARGDTPAHEFRIQARIYRELLRKLSLDDRELPGDERLPQDLLLNMVRMSALLHSAADCKTGLVITCPAELVLQLRSQQREVEQALEMVRLTRD